VPLGVLGQLVGGDLCSRAQRYERDDILAEPLVGTPHHPGLGHGRMGDHDLLDVPGKDVEPAPQDQVLLPVHHVQVAVVVQVADVPGVQPAVDQHRRGGAGGVPVAAHYAGRPHADLAILAGRKRRAVIGLDHHLDPGGGQPDAADPASLGRSG
jgi:hypothetical protein